MLTQFFLAVFGLSAIWMATGRSARLRRWAPVMGLCGQPFWFWFAWDARAWGLFLLCVAYTLVYARGAWVQWQHA